MIFWLNRRGFTTGYLLAMLGALVLVTGVIVDLARHAAGDAHPDERIFTASNPGHVIAIAGMYVLAAGLLIGGLSRWVLGRLSQRASFAALGLSLAAVAVFSAGLVRLDARIAEHDDASAEADHSHGGIRVARPENDLFARIEALTFHEPAVSAPVTPENLRFAEDFLESGRAGTERYRNVDAAIADGYIQVTPYIPVIGAHFGNPRAAADLRAGVIDPAKPPILLYRQAADGSLALAGASYALPKSPGDANPPATPFGGLVQWHYHTNLCFDRDAGTVVPAPDDSSCDGIFVAETPWLLHAWLWLDSPEGVFDHANSLLQ